MLTKEILYKILWSTIEEFTGLWEIHWELNSLFPQNSSEENREIGKKILIYFLETDFIRIYFDKWGVDKLKAVDKLDEVKVLNDNKFWEAPLINEICIKAGCTVKGEEVYKNELIDDLIPILR